MKIIRTHTVCVDSATTFHGTVAQVEIGRDGKATYYLRPKGLCPETGAPLQGFPVEAWRLNVTDADYEERDVPIGEIGKVVKDKVSGYTGTIIGIVIHLNGCLHYILQAAGPTKDGNRIRAIEVDPRSCENAVVPKKQTDSPDGERVFGEQFGAH